MRLSGKQGWRRYLLAVLVLFPLLAGQASAQPAEVRAGVYVTAIHGIDFARGSVDLSFWLWWVHGIADYKPAEDFELVNARQFRVDARGEEKLADGRTYAYAKVTATLSQSWDGKNVPFDHQVIRIIVEPFDRIANEIRLVPDVAPSRISPDIQIIGWRLEPLKLEAADFSYLSDFGEVGVAASDAFSRLQATIPIVRVGTTKLFASYTGFMVAIFLSLLTFFVNVPHLPPRMTIAAAATFTAVGNTYIVAGEFPAASEFSLSSKIEMTAFAVLCIAVVSAIACHRRHERGDTAGAIRLNRTVGILAAAGGIGFVAVGVVIAALDL